MNDDIRAKKLIYHLTSLSNMQAILGRGLMPRAQLQGFVDVADPDIIADRGRLHLEQHVPFHFFARNPFDGRVQHDHPQKRFALIAVQRAVARARGWRVIPRHPLAGREIEILDYDTGMNSIDWDVMNRRDYSDQNCKCVCMAECLSPETVPPSLFQAIYVKDSASQAYVLGINGGRYQFHVDVAPAMFSK